MTKVVNIKDVPSDFRENDIYVYIGRERGSIHHYGSPFYVDPDGSRNDVIKKFQLWLAGLVYTHIESRRRTWILNNLEFLEGKILVCHCKPKACHGDIYIILLGEKKDG